MADRVRINVRTLTNTKKVRREKRNGRDVIIVPAATMPDGVIMNGFMYPGDEIEKSYKSLERSPSPLGHPTINGKFVSARDPEGINLGWIGAWNENVRREKGRVFMDKVIDVERAQSTEGGKAVLNAIDAGEPIATSTGLFCVPEAANGEVDYKFTARNIEFDHDAILMNEEPAATPEQGVGIFVNSKGEEEQIQVINSAIEDSYDHEIDWAGTRLIEAVRRKADASKWQELKSRLLKALGLDEEDERASATNKKEDAMSKEELDALSGKVDALSESIGGLAKSIGETVASAVTNALKPLTDAQAEIVANQKVKDEAEKAELVTKVVAANMATEEEAKGLELPALRILAKNAEPKGAAAFNGNSAFRALSQKTPADAYKVPKAEA